MTLDKKNLPSRYITQVHGCEGRRTMLENLKTETFPEGMGPHLDKPFVCVVDTGNESAPCNSDLHRQAGITKRGVLAAGGTPFGVSTITVTDGIAMGHQGMKSSLASREVIADSVELSVRGHCYDAGSGKWAASHRKSPCRVVPPNQYKSSTSASSGKSAARIRRATSSTSAWLR